MHTAKWEIYDEAKSHRRTLYMYYEGKYISMSEGEKRDAG